MKDPTATNQKSLNLTVFLLLLFMEQLQMTMSNMSFKVSDERSHELFIARTWQMQHYK